MSRAPYNILALITDQHRLDTLGCYGNSVCETPALNALADSGTRYDRAFTPTAICTPTRATIVTGVLPFRHTLLANYERNVGYREELDGTFAPFSTQLLEAGYNVGHVGKWHVGKVRGPADYGFDGEHYPGWGNPVQHPDYQRYLEQRELPPFRLLNEVRGSFPNGEPGNLLAGVLDQPVEATFEYFLAERTIQRLHQYAEDGKPFYLACNWFGPHLPYCLPREYYDRYDPADVRLPASVQETFARKPAVQQHYSRHWTFDSFTLDEWRKLIAVYWGYVTMIDEQVARVLQTLDELGLRDQTGVIFTADHGEFTGAHRLHDKGPAMYDDIYRIPFLARLPGQPAGRIDASYVSLTDLPATYLDLAGLPVPDHYDGRSLLDPAPRAPEIVCEFHGHHFPYPQRMIRTEDHKLVVNPGDRNELYDLRLDPDELHNRYDHPELASVRGELLRRLYDVLVERGDNFYHWMTSAYEIGAMTYDTSLSQLETTT